MPSTTGIKTSDNSSNSSEKGQNFDYSANIDDNEEITIEEFRANVEMMNRIMAENVKNMEKGSKEKKTKDSSSDSIIDGNFLSVVFAVVFLMIICVSVYAFNNLFIAILKKFPSKHTEL